jgi:hypothetical protein
MIMVPAAAAGKVFPAALQTRIDLTLSCRDSDTIPKVADAGIVVERDGACLQVMHDGTLVHADGYCGAWITEIIRRLRGHHEPQEELIFHHLLPHARPGSLIVELGAWWAYYTNWYLGAVQGAVILAEHDVLESSSGDGLIAASFCRDDASIALPPLSRLRGRNPLW